MYQEAAVDKLSNAGLPYTAMRSNHDVVASSTPSPFDASEHWALVALLTPASAYTIIITSDIQRSRSHSVSSASNETQTIERRKNGGRITSDSAVLD